MLCSFASKRFYFWLFHISLRWARYVELQVLRSVEETLKAYHLDYFQPIGNEHFFEKGNATSISGE